jgi:hypothetical protein
VERADEKQIDPAEAIVAMDDGGESQLLPAIGQCLSEQERGLEVQMDIDLANDDLGRRPRHCHAQTRSTPCSNSSALTRSPLSEGDFARRRVLKKRPESSEQPFEEKEASGGEARSTRGLDVRLRKVIALVQQFRLEGFGMTICEAVAHVELGGMLHAFAIAGSGFERAVSGVRLDSDDVNSRRGEKFNDIIFRLRERESERCRKAIEVS